MKNISNQFRPFPLNAGIFPVLIKATGQQEGSVRVLSDTRLHSVVTTQLPCADPTAISLIWRMYTALQLSVSTECSAHTGNADVNRQGHSIYWESHVLFGVNTAALYKPTGTCSVTNLQTDTWLSYQEQVDHTGIMSTVRGPEFIPDRLDRSANLTAIRVTHQLGSWDQPAFVELCTCCSFCCFLCRNQRK